jgi:hypothetical protein
MPFDKGLLCDLTGAAPDDEEAEESPWLATRAAGVLGLDDKHWHCLLELEERRKKPGDMNWLNRQRQKTAAFLQRYAESLSRDVKPIPIVPQKESLQAKKVRVLFVTSLPRLSPCMSVPR